MPRQCIDGKTLLEGNHNIMNIQGLFAPQVRVEKHY